jgi:hypothetical protein
MQWRPHSYPAAIGQGLDVDHEAQRIDDERLNCVEPSDGLWELDIGVAAAFSFPA